MKIKRQDTILVITGKDRGKTGKVEKVLHRTNRLIVAGVNIVKRHVKPNKSNPQGGIIDVTRSIPASNAQIICPNCHKATRIGYKDTDKGKIRICRKCDASVDQE